MNNTFNAKRFGLLFKKTLLEKPMQMFGFTGLVFLLVLIVYYIFKTFVNFQAAQGSSFLWGLVGGDFILASFMFNYFNSTASGSSYLTLPVSNFEKWLCAVVIAGILYPMVFLIFYRIMDAGFVAAYHNSLDPNAPFYKIRYDAVYLLSFDAFLPRQSYPMFLVYSGMMLIGSLYFNKAALVKVALAICILCFAIYGLNYLFARLMFNNIDDAFPFLHVSILVGKEVGTVELPKSIHDTVWKFITFVLPVILWGVAFIRLREKEF
ncbi:MAG: hypothetical protein ABI184_01755 [Ginsengibacter sp.]